MVLQVLSYDFLVCCHMPVEGPALGKWYPANGALVRFLSRVLPHVPGQLPGLAELLAALLAPKWLLSSMGPRVVLQVPESKIDLFALFHMCHTECVDLPTTSW